MTGTAYKGVDPYESPIECIFGLNAMKYLAEDAAIDEQSVLQTLAGKFRLDFLIIQRGLRVAVECDGKDFHEDDYRGEWRDALILGANGADAIFRFDGSQLFHGVEGCLLFMAHFYPTLFSDRGLRNLLKLGSTQTRPSRPALPRRQVVPPNHKELWWLMYAEAKYRRGSYRNLDDLLAIHLHELDLWFKTKGVEGKPFDYICERCNKPVSERGEIAILRGDVVHRSCYLKEIRFVPPRMPDVFREEAL